MSKAVKDILKKIKDKNIRFVDLRFTDPRGKWHHLTMDVGIMDEKSFTEGVMFDGSSIAGWRSIHESDMTLIPDPQNTFIDPFFALPTMVIPCDVYEPISGKPYGRDPRSTAKRAEMYLKKTGIGDKAIFGPEAEFFVFDDVRYTAQPYESFYSIDSTELPDNSGKDYEAGNMGHRPHTKGGYFPVPPVDGAQDLRSEMIQTLTEIGLETEKHHHEVGAAQHELGFKFDTLTACADKLQAYKYTVHNVAQSYGKTATFMPKPVFGDNGTGMHVHQSIWRGKTPLFSGKKYAGLSQDCLYYIGGIIKHARALNCFTNPSTNSYKRLVPGYEAPVLLAYSARNRSASCRIPHAPGAKGKRVEVRFPDPTANPYYAFSAMLMAGLDGIKNKINPGDPMDKDLYDLSEKDLGGIPKVCGSLREACEALHSDRAFLKRGGVFNDDQIDAYLALKHEEVLRLEQAPHPVEFEMYYSV